MTKFLLIRHAITDEVGKKLSGRLPGVHLNNEGIEQAQKLSEHLHSLSIDTIYSSPLERAMETAKPLAKILNQEVWPNEDFLEINFGDWTNFSFKELETQPQFQLFNTFRSSTRIPGGESMVEAQARMINGLQKLCTKHQDKTIAIISHSDMIKATISYYTGIHLDMFHRIEISPASVSIVEVYAETARITLLNQTVN